MSLRKRIDEFDWDWETAGRYERHAINAVLDLEEAERLNRELLEAAEYILRDESTLNEGFRMLRAAVRKAKGLGIGHQLIRKEGA